MLRSFIWTDLQQSRCLLLSEKCWDAVFVFVKEIWQLSAPAICWEVLGGFCFDCPANSSVTNVKYFYSKGFKYKNKYYYGEKIKSNIDF